MTKPSDISRLAAILHEMEPGLTLRACKILAAEYARIAHRIATEEWSVSDLADFKLRVAASKPSLFGEELKELRIVAGLTRPQAAQAAGWSVSKLLRVEAGSVGISKSDLTFLLDLYSVDPTLKSQLLGNARGEHRS